MELQEPRTMPLADIEKVTAWRLRGACLWVVVACLFYCPKVKELRLTLEVRQADVSGSS